MKDIIRQISYICHHIDHIQPSSLVVQPGQSLTITCQVSGYSLTDSGYGTGWIRQREGKLLDWIFYIWYDGNTYQNDALKNKFSMSRDTSQLYLQMNSLKTEDSAVYYCARNPQLTNLTVSVLQNPKSKLEY
uniref:Immunoglobulin heavy variable 6-1 n=1 Tax=Oreochromis niloticus TaxID=8128 RepID=A0A669F0E1_ORENI